MAAILKEVVSCKHFHISEKELKQREVRDYLFLHIPNCRLTKLKTILKPTRPICIQEQEDFFLICYDRTVNYEEIYVFLASKKINVNKEMNAENKYITCLFGNFTATFGNITV